MVIAFVLINIEPGGVTETIREIRKIEGVKMAYPLFGVYDIIVMLEDEDRKRLEDLIVWKIRKLDRVRQTITNWVHERTSTST